jgi:hypothetical protein
MEEDKHQHQQDDMKSVFSSSSSSSSSSTRTIELVVEKKTKRAFSFVTTVNTIKSIIPQGQLGRQKWQEAFRIY